MLSNVPTVATIEQGSTNIQTDVHQERDTSGASETEIRERVDAILLCMEAAYKNYVRDWAKAPVDRLFSAASQRRLGVPADLREKLDDLTTLLTKEQRQVRSGATGQQTVRTYNSVTHPLLQRRVGILR
eukprot:CAMPEP_0182421190 /NCGR_PEP_ID=MMETSP1167-20130531/6443_1 /TAXON_ID=2988 /ORGANISM="Mallomonas Sp, Strain CCMP3275" /LENGTH=128 /DNA_ID=CAMNT_0024598059 /DNA_START=1063 /DNA_END=1449 /DNA_ORIENTATION=-